jgi:hypothetical protein
VNGWIKLHRKLQSCWIWEIDKPFDERSAWVDLLLTANHSEKKLMNNGELIIIHRGQIMTSIRKLSEKWKWSKNRTYRFLKILEQDNMLQRESNKDRTLLTIVNYDIYQYSQDSDEDTNGHSEKDTNEDTDGTTERTPTRTLTEHKQEYKNIKNDKEREEVKEREKEKVEDKSSTKKKIVFLTPTVDEVREYCESVGSQVDAESFVAFYESNGWMVGKNKMKSWKSAIVTWEKRGNLKRNTPKKHDEEKTGRFANVPEEFVEMLKAKGAIIDEDVLVYSEMTEDERKKLSEYGVDV